MATNPRVAAYEADKRAQNLYNSITKPKPAMAAKGPALVGAKKPTPTIVGVTGSKPKPTIVGVTGSKPTPRPTNKPMTTNKPMPAGSTKPITTTEFKPGTKLPVNSIKAMLAKLEKAKKK